MNRVVEEIKKVAVDPKDPIDVKREFSSQGGAKTFVDEENGARNISFEVENNTSDDAIIVFGNAQRSIYGSVAEALSALNVRNNGHFIADGILRTTPDGDLTAKSVDQGRSINEMITYTGNAPTRIVALSIQSALIDGSPDVTNLTGQIRQSWTSPFENTKDRYLPLRKYQNNQSNSPQFADVNFKNDGFEVIWSNEHFFMLTVKKGTRLNLTFSVGMQDSRPQRFHRAIRKADEVVRRIAKMGGAK